MAVARNRVDLRPAVESLPAYVPGGQVPPGAAAFKLSSNENPFPPLPSVLAAIADAAADANRYPDMYADELCRSIADMHSVEPDRIVVGNGSVSVLSHILQTVVEPGDEVVFPWRSFEAYPIAVSVAGGVGVRVPLRSGAAAPDAAHTAAPDAAHTEALADTAGRLDLDAMADAITDRTKVVLVCTPNNPTGPAVHTGELDRFLARVPSDVLVVIDEAYIEFVRDRDVPDGVDLVAKHPNVVALRTFSKAYGLAGLRVGYALGRPRIISGVRAVSTPFGVSSLAQRAAVASLDARAELLDRVQRVVDERTWLDARLRDQGWEFPRSEANFVWLEAGDRTMVWAEEAKESGVILRPFAGEGIRISVGEREASELLLKVAAGWR